MKKIYKNTIQKAKTANFENTKNTNFIEILPNLLKLFPNFDISKMINKLFLKNEQNASHEPQKHVNFEINQTLNSKLCEQFLEKHQNNIQKIKNRPT